MEVSMPEHDAECKLPMTSPPTAASCGMSARQPSSSSATSSHCAGDVPAAGDSAATAAERYGELVILGYNGALTSGDKGRRRSKYVLYKRTAPNGVKPARYYEVKQPQMSQAILDRRQHSVSYTLSRHKAIIVEYSEDVNTDMFQVGRSSEPPIDFVVLDTIPGVKAEDTRDSKLVHSTISRFSCRILVNRATCKANVFAAGFDSSCNIFLGEKATKWETDGIIDGLTTNGVLLMHPRGWCCHTASTPPPPPPPQPDSRCSANGHSCSASAAARQPSQWTEVSVGGGIYGLRTTRSAAQKGPKIASESSELQDGSLLDLCGATLLWRSADGLRRSPTKRDLERMVDQLNAGRPQCPVGLNTLVIPRRSSGVAPSTDNNNSGAGGGGAGAGVLGGVPEREPWVYLQCGHVQGRHQWGLERGTDTRTCPICMTAGPVVRLCMGMEPSFHVNVDPPSHAFNPCGHMASEATARYWAAVQIPHGTNGFHAMCPFCATPLTVTAPHVRLIFQDNLD